MEQALTILAALAVRTALTARPTKAEACMGALFLMMLAAAFCGVSALCLALSMVLGALH